jgi:hypothetical protein
MSEEFLVNGLNLPSLLIDLLQRGKWVHPGHKVLMEIIPFLHDRVIFLKSIEAMRFETRGMLPDDEIWGPPFHQLRGSKQTNPVELPWLDIDRAIFIAVNLEIGADVAIALDYRTDFNDPRVVASEWPSTEHLWREVTPTFSQFVEQIGLNRT